MTRLPMFALPAFAAGGTELWSSRFNDTANGADEARSLALSPDGSRLFVTGTASNADGRTDFATFAYDPGTGATLWSRRYDGPLHTNDEANAVAVSRDGTRVFVVGWVYGFETYTDFGIVAYDALTGSMVWTRNYDGPGHGIDEATSVAVSPDGRLLFVTGESGGLHGTQDFATVAYDAANGRMRWVRSYDGTGHANDFPEALAVSPDGSRVFVTGRSPSPSTAFDYATMGYNAMTGARLWARRYDGPGHGVDAAASMTVSPDGASVFVTGQSDGSNGRPDYATLAYEAATGAVIWTTRYDDQDGLEDDAWALAASPDGSRVFVTGSSRAGATGFDYVPVAYDALTGTPLWTSRYDGPVNADDMAHALSPSPDGTKVFVSGSSTGTDPDGASDYATLAYDAGTGQAMWTARYDGPDLLYDIPASLAASPDGSIVFVTGLSRARGASSDFATVAYEA